MSDINAGPIESRQFMGPPGDDTLEVNRQLLFMRRMRERALEGFGPGSSHDGNPGLRTRISEYPTSGVTDASRPSPDDPNFELMTISMPLDMAEGISGASADPNRLRGVAWIDVSGQPRPIHRNLIPGMVAVDIVVKRGTTLRALYSQATAWRIQDALSRSEKVPSKTLTLSQRFRALRQAS